MIASRLCQDIQIKSHLINHRFGLQVAPDILHRIQLRSIRRQKIQLPVFLLSDEVLNSLGSMAHEAVPYQGNGTLQMPVEIFEESEHRCAIDIGVGVKTKEQLHAIPAGRNDQGGDGGNFPIGVGLLPKYRRLTAWCPGSPYMRRHQKAALINEHESSAYSCGVFFTLGQSVLIQR